MTSIPPFTRLTLGLQRRLLLSNLGSTMTKIADDEAKIATGKRLLRPSSDPLSTRLVLEFERMVSRNEQYMYNAENGARQLGLSDASLGSVENLIIRARELALEMLNATSSPDMRRAAALEIKQLIGQAVAAGNTKLGDRFIFGGTETNKTAFEFDELGFVRYHGNDELQYVNISNSTAIPINVPGSGAFGALDVHVEGKGPDGTGLNPAADLDTRLKDLNNTPYGPEGVDRGVFRIYIKTLTAQEFEWDIDISTAEDLRDVKSMVESVTNGNVTMSVIPSGLELTCNIPGIELFEITDRPGYTTATDLGIVTKPALWMTATLQGDDLNPAVARSTKLDNLLGGTFNRDAFTITYGSASKTIDLGVQVPPFFTDYLYHTVGDVIDLINDADLGVTARIAADKTGIEVIGNITGVRLDISGGLSARDLGLLTLTMNKLSDLNGGSGVGTAWGAHELPDMRIQTHAGTSAAVDSSVGLGDFTSAAIAGRNDIFPGQKIYFTGGANNGLEATIVTYDRNAGTVTFDPPVGAAFAIGDTFDIRTELDIDIDGAETLQDVIDIINTHPDNIYPIVRTVDAIPPPGLNQFNCGAIAGRSDISAGQKLVFMSGANAGYVATVLNYDPFTGRVTFSPPAGVAVGAGDSFAIYTSSRLMTAGLNAAGDGLELTDNTLSLTGLPGGNDFEITNLNRSTTATDLEIEQLPLPPGLDVISGNPLNPLGVFSGNIFAALLQLKDGMASNDLNLISRGLGILEDAERDFLGARADVGGRVQRVDLAVNMLEDENLSIEGLLSEERDANIAEVIVDFQLRQTMLQAALAATGQILGISLLDYI